MVIPGVQWDQPLDVTPLVRMALAYLFDTIPGVAALGQPIWPIVAVSLYHKFHSGQC